MNDPTLALFGAIVAQNVADATHTTNLLLTVKDEQIERLARGLVDIGRALDAATVIDRKTEARLQYLCPVIEDAEFILSRMEENR